AWLPWTRWVSSRSSSTWTAGDKLDAGHLQREHEQAVVRRPHAAVVGRDAPGNVGTSLSSPRPAPTPGAGAGPVAHAPSPSPPWNEVSGGRFGLSGHKTSAGPPGGSAESGVA